MDAPHTCFTWDVSGTQVYDDGIFYNPETRKLRVYIALPSFYPFSAKELSHILVGTQDAFSLSPEMMSMASLDASATRHALYLEVQLDVKAEPSSYQVGTCQVLCTHNLDWTQQPDYEQYLGLRDFARAQCMSRPGDLAKRIVDRGGHASFIVHEVMLLTNRVLSRHSRNCDVPLVYRTYTKGEDPKLSAQASIHEGLELDGYAQFTSPLRRGQDFANMLNLHALLDGKPIPLQTAELAACVFLWSRSALSVPEPETTSEVVVIEEKKRFHARGFVYRELTLKNLVTRTSRAVSDGAVYTVLKTLMLHPTWFKKAWLSLYQRTEVSVRVKNQTHAQRLWVDYLGFKVPENLPEEIPLFACTSSEIQLQQWAETQDQWYFLSNPKHSPEDDLWRVRVKIGSVLLEGSAHSQGHARLEAIHLALYHVLHLTPWDPFEASYSGLQKEDSCLTQLH